jgi:hypothetical protein
VSKTVISLFPRAHRLLTAPGQLVWGGSHFIDTVGEGRIYLEHTVHGPKMVAEMTKRDGSTEIQTIELSEKIANVGGRLQYMVSSRSTCVGNNWVKSILMSENRMVEWFGQGDAKGTKY